MSLRSVCKTNVVTVEKGATLAEVAKLMHERHVGCVVVTEARDEKKIPYGIISDRDLALSLGSEGRPQEIKVESLMQSQPFTCRVRDGIFESIVKMREHGVRRLPVLNEDGSLYGILSADDLLNILSQEMIELSKIGETQISKEKGARLPTERHV